MAERPVKLRVQLRNARLYAFQFAGGGEQPWQRADLDRPIPVGAEVTPAKDGAHSALSGANQSRSRCQLIIGEFAAVRIFARLQGRKGERSTSARRVSGICVWRMSRARSNTLLSSGVTP